MFIGNNPNSNGGIYSNYGNGGSSTILGGDAFFDDITQSTTESNGIVLAPP